jgi:hypothetical protein
VLRANLAASGSVPIAAGKEARDMPATPDFGLLLVTGCAECPVCGRPDSVVAPDDCPDGHGADCPDRMCLSCGSAMSLGPAASPTLGPALDIARHHRARSA